MSNPATLQSKYAYFIDEVKSRPSLLGASKSCPTLHLRAA
jgi:hypothetical protein